MSALPLHLACPMNAPLEVIQLLVEKWLSQWKDTFTPTTESRRVAHSWYKSWWKLGLKLSREGHLWMASLTCKDGLYRRHFPWISHAAWMRKKFPCIASLMLWEYAQSLNVIKLLVERWPRWCVKATFLPTTVSRWAIGHSCCGSAAHAKKSHGSTLQHFVLL